MVHRVKPRLNIPGNRFGTFHEGMNHFPNDPLLSTYKRGHPPPHLNNTTRKRARSKSNTLRLRP
jgi:hypothetical protein